MSRRVSIFGSSFASMPVYLPQTLAYMPTTGIADDANMTIYGITGTQVWQAVDTFFGSGIAGGWLSEMLALYLYIGGTATTHKFNAVNPLDTDAAFRVTWAGTITHSAQGVKGNGVNGWGDTHLIYANDLQPYSASLGYYNSLNDWVNGTSDMGARGPGSLPIFSIFKSFVTENRIFADGLDFSAHRIFGAIAGGTGMFDMAIESNVSQSIAKNGVMLGSVNAAPQTQLDGPTVPIALMTRNDSGTPVQFSPATYNMHYIANGLTIAERFNFYNSIHALQVTLNRPAI